MAINFPTSPSTNDTHTHNDVTYKWDGTSWLAQGSTSTYSLPTASSTVLGGIKVGTRLTINSGVLEADVQGGVSSDANGNTVAGTDAGSSITTATNNTLYGYQAGEDITTSSDNVIIGQSAQQLTTGPANTSNGFNTIVGNGIATSATFEGQRNTLVGYSIATNNTAATYSHNVGIGSNCYEQLSSGNQNCAGGYQCLDNLTSGIYNSAWGSYAGDTLTTGSNCSFLGYQATPSSATVDNEITLGNTSVDRFRIPGINVDWKDSTATEDYVLTVDANGQCGWEAATGGTNTTYDLTAENGSVATEEKIQLSGSDNSEDSVTLAVDASSSLTIARANNKITFGGGTYSAGTGLSLSGTTFNVTSTYTSSRTTAAATTSSIADQASGNIDITAAKAYALLKIQTSHAAWVTLYTDTTSRTSDANRNITTDPLPGSGVVAEVLLSDGGVQKITPGLIGYNDDATPSTKVYAKVQNRSGSAATITVTLHYLALEG